MHPDEKEKRKTRLTRDDRRTGKNLRRPHQLVAVDGVGDAMQRRLEEDRLATDRERIIGGKVRRYFESTNPRQRGGMTTVEGVVELCNKSAKLFRIRYTSHRIGDDAEDLDLMALQDVLIMGKEYGDARAD